MMSLLVNFANFLASGTGRRAAAFVIGFLLPVINKQFNWNLSEGQVLADIGFAAAYIAQSAAREAHATGVAAAAEVETPEDAAAVFNDAKPTPVNTVPPAVAPVKVEE